jgi:hypothetical protein
MGDPFLEGQMLFGSMARDLAWHMVHTRIKRLIGNATILFILTKSQFRDWLIE